MIERKNGEFKMNIVLLRHGEATENVKGLISDKEIYWSTLTDEGINMIKESIKSIPLLVDKIYVSPLPRTIQTAHYVSNSLLKAEVIIENRIREIQHGKYTHQKNNEDLDNTRIKQIEGDYFVRLGEYGENNYDIENRLCLFLKDIYQNNFKDNTILIVTHGSISSYIKRMLNVKTAHLQTGKLEVFNDVDFKPLFNHIKKLNRIRNEKVNNRIEQVNSLYVNPLLKKSLLQLSKNEFNSLYFTDLIFNKYIEGFKTDNLCQITNPTFDGNIILICFYSNFDNFVDYWMSHYLSIGIKNFVLVDNNSDDNTTRKLKKYEGQANISFWQINEKYNSNNMCGWKQRIFEFYGIGNIFITVDSDELFIYENYKSIKIDEFIRNNKLTYVKALMLDVYSKNKLYKSNLNDYIYIDKGTYKIDSSVSYGKRFYGGPHSRLFGINPSLQKIPLIKYTGKEVFANDHFYYPYNINVKAKYCAYLLHYKILFGDEKKLSFYNKDVSVLADSIDFNFRKGK